MQPLLASAAVASCPLRWAKVLLSALAFALIPNVGLTAQIYPSKPVRILSGQPPGGAIDLFARMVSQKLSESWKQPVVIEYRPGAGGSIAVEVATKAPPDGYTLVFVGAGQIVINPYLSKLTYDPITDLTPVAFLVHACMLLVVHPSVPAKSAKALIALAKAQPGKLNVSSGGNGAPTHLAAELLQSLTGTNMTHVAYKGASPSIVAVATGETDLSFGSVTATMGHAKAGRVRALGVSTSRRSQAWPELPTLAESGVPGYDMSSWYAFFGPPGMPKDTLERIHAEIGRIAAQPEFQERMRREGAEHEAMTLDRFGQFNRAESTRWGKVIRERNIKAQ